MGGITFWSKIAFYVLIPHWYIEGKKRNEKSYPKWTKNKILKKSEKKQPSAI